MRHTLASSGAESCGNFHCSSVCARCLTMCPGLRVREWRCIAVVAVGLFALMLLSLSVTATTHHHLHTQVQEYNASGKGCISTMLDTKVIVRERTQEQEEGGGRFDGLLAAVHMCGSIELIVPVQFHHHNSCTTYAHLPFARTTTNTST